MNINQAIKLVNSSISSSSRGLSQPLIRYHFNNIKNYAMKDQKKKMSNYDDYNKQYSGSVEQIVKKRHQQQKFIQLEEEKKHDLEIFVEAYSDTVIEFKLYGDHYDPKTQAIDALLNYYQVSYLRMFNPIYHERIRTQFESQVKDSKLPLLRINISMEPAFFLEIDKMEQWLIDQNFIMMPKHRTHSAWALQGIDFAENRVHQAFNKLFWAPALTFELYWKSHAKSYTEMSRKALALRVARLQLQQILKNIWKNVGSIRKDLDGYKQARAEVLKLIDEWKGRLEENDYHGGAYPDEADFAMYGVIMAKYNSRSFQRFIENHWPTPVRRWFIRMQQNCQYEKRNLYN